MSRRQEDSQLIVIFSIIWILWAIRQIRAVLRKTKRLTERQTEQQTDIQTDIQSEIKERRIDRAGMETDMRQLQLTRQVGEGGFGEGRQKADRQTGRQTEAGQRPNIIETMHSYTLPMQCLSELHISLLTGGTAVCGHSYHLGLTGTPPPPPPPASSRYKLCLDSALQV